MYTYFSKIPFVHIYNDSRQDFSTSQTIPFPFFKPKMGPQMKPMGSEKCPFFVKKFEFTKKRLLFEASILRKKVPKKVSFWRKKVSFWSILTSKMSFFRTKSNLLSVQKQIFLKIPLIYEIFLFFSKKVSSEPPNHVLKF